jgi:hypothetical protein
MRSTSGLNAAFAKNDARGNADDAQLAEQVCVPLRGFQNGLEKSRTISSKDFTETFRPGREASRAATRGGSEEKDGHCVRACPYHIAITRGRQRLLCAKPVKVAVRRQWAGQRPSLERRDPAP